MGDKGIKRCPARRVVSAHVHDTPIRQIGGGAESSHQWKNEHGQIWMGGKEKGALSTADGGQRREEEGERKAGPPGTNPLPPIGKSK